MISPHTPRITLEDNLSQQRRIILAAVILAGILDFFANYLAAHYLVSFNLGVLGEFLVPGGTFVFALTFTVYDFVRRQGGLYPTLAAIGLGFAASMLWALVFGGGMGRIAIAGLVALVFSSTADIAVQTLTIRWPIWRYVAASNAVSLLVDSVVFVTVAFAMLPADVQRHIIEGQYLVKLAVTLVSIPLVYGARALAPRPA